MIHDAGIVHLKPYRPRSIGHQGWKAITAFVLVLGVAVAVLAGVVR